MTEKLQKDIKNAIKSVNIDFDKVSEEMENDVREQTEEEKKFEKWLRKYLLCYDCKNKCTCIQLNAYCEEQVKQAFKNVARKIVSL